MTQKNGFEQPAAMTSDAEYIWGTGEEKEGASLPDTALSPRLLLVAADTELQAFLELALREEGYAFQVASSLEQALALASTETFDFVLADLSFGSPRNLFRTIRPLKDRVQPIKLGVIVRGTVSSEEVEKHGLAFAMSRPIAAEQLLVKLAICLQRALTPEQAWQARTVSDFFEMLTLKDKARLLTLCTEDFVYYPAAHCPPPLAILLRSRAALASYVETLRSSYSGLRLELEHIYSRPEGLVAQYSIYWAESNHSWEMLSGMFLVQFTGSRIRQIGLQAETH